MWERQCQVLPRATRRWVLDISAGLRFRDYGWWVDMLMVVDGNVSSTELSGGYTQCTAQPLSPVHVVHFWSQVPAVRVIWLDGACP